MLTPWRARKAVSWAWAEAASWRCAVDEPLTYGLVDLIGQLRCIAQPIDQTHEACEAETVVLSPSIAVLAGVVTDTRLDRARVKPGGSEDAVELEQTGARGDAVGRRCGQVDADMRNQELLDALDERQSHGEMQHLGAGGDDVIADGDEVGCAESDAIGKHPVGRHAARVDAADQALLDLDGLLVVVHSVDDRPTVLVEAVGDLDRVGLARQACAIEEQALGVV